MSLLNSPHVRLAVRAVLQGVNTAVVFLQAADDPVSGAVWKGAIAAGIHAALETFTPLNQLVGWWKNPK